MWESIKGLLFLLIQHGCGLKGLESWIKGPNYVGVDQRAQIMWESIKGLKLCGKRSKGSNYVGVDQRAQTTIDLCT